MGFICYLVMIALGEMSPYLPYKKSFAGHATRYVDPAFGSHWDIIISSSISFSRRTIQRCRRDGSVPDTLCSHKILDA